MEEFIAYIVKNMVEKPDEVEVQMPFLWLCCFGSGL